MADSILIALIVSLAPTLTALASWFRGRHNTGKLDVIHGMVNSNLHKVQEALEKALSEIKRLNKLLEVRKHSHRSTD